MARSSRNARAARSRPAGRARTAGVAPAAERDGLVVAVLVALLWAIAVVFDPRAVESFRLPKLLAAEALGLVSLLVLLLRRSGSALPVAAARGAAWRTFLPVFVVAAVGALVAPQRQAVLDALPHLAIAGACLVGWSAGLSEAAHERLRSALVPPAVLLAVIGILQAHDLFQPFALGERYIVARTYVTSLAGNPGDFGAALVLPALVLQAQLAGRTGRRRTLAAVLLAVVAYGLLASGTLAAMGALVAGSLVLWAPRVRRRARVAVIAGAAVVLALTLTLVVPALRARVAEKVGAVQAGDLNSLLTGRLDGWRAAGWMVREHPLTGVGLDGFELAFGEAKLALVEAGVPFWRSQTQVIFSEAHNEVLQVAAELGIPGLLALLAAVVLVARAAWRLPAGERSLAVAGLVALAVLSLAWFPAHVAIVGYPALLWLAAVLRPRGDGGGDSEAVA